MQGTEGRRIDTQWLRNLCLHAGADDVGFVSIDRNELGDQREEILNLFPEARTLISFVCKMNREPCVRRLDPLQIRNFIMLSIM